MTSLPSFHAVEWTPITGRGDLAYVTDPHPAPRTLVDQDVLIDGHQYRVRGVETNCVPDHLVANKPFGLLVAQRTTGRVTVPQDMRLASYPDLIRPYVDRAMRAVHASEDVVMVWVLARNPWLLHHLAVTPEWAAYKAAFRG